jgi:predicted methyltransferase
MRIVAILIAVVALVSGAIASDNASNSTAATMAVADPSRPDSDTTRDADRRPAQTLVFVGIKSGDKVADYVADAGYSRVAAGSRPDGSDYESYRGASVIRPPGY